MDGLRHWSEKLSSDETGSENNLQTPASALLFQAPEFTAPVFQEPKTPPPGGGDLKEDGAAGEDGRPRRGQRGKSQSDRSGDAQADDEANGGAAERGAKSKGKAKSGRSRQRGKHGGEAEADTKAKTVGEEGVPGAEENRGAQAKAQDAKDKDTKDQERAGSASGDDAASGDSSDSAPTVRRRRRRSRSDEGESDSDQVQAVKGSTRLEAKRMRRREGRKEGRRRHSITEAEFLARRESVDRQMIVRHENGSDQVAVLEDGILVEHFVARRTNQSIVGNIYLGKVQNVLPSMEAAFVDVGRGRNAVLYAGEVNWDALGMQGKPRRIESALQPGDNVMVQVTKDPIGHKGARLTSQITLAGRYLVLVPGSSVLGISRKLPDNERNRLKKALKAIVPETAGVIVRTAAEGATDEQLRDDVERLTRQWEAVEKKAATTRKAPVLLRGEPELVVRVVRDLFNEDVSSLTVQGDETWDTVHEYVEELSPELLDRLHHWTAKEDVFDAKKIRSQLAKGMDRKVWLPSGGTLIIERTEALTVIDVNTGKFVGSGGTLEETVTRNNLEAAEEIVRQLRLRDIGGIIIIDFVDMVLEANRELVLRRLVESLGRDRTRHQVTEITSLGLVQMTRKRVGEGLVEAFSTTCEVCDGRGFIVHDHPVETGQTPAGKPKRKGPSNEEKKGRTREEKSVPHQDSHVGEEKVKSALTAIAAATAASSPADAKESDSEKDSPTQAPRRPARGSRRAVRATGAPANVSPTPAPDTAHEDEAAEKERATEKPRSVDEIVLPAKELKTKVVARRPRRRAVVTGPLETGKATGSKSAPAPEVAQEKQDAARAAVRDLFEG